MTNEQLAVLLHGYAKRLEEAMEYVDEELGDAVGRREISSWNYVGSKTGLGRAFSNQFTDPGDRQQIIRPGQALALSPLQELLDDMQCDIETPSSQEA